ncbi:MAG: HD domain-containing protein [Clostridia bacterium]|nr:HD domain-containing protein [Clostridia bacterium]
MITAYYDILFLLSLVLGLAYVFMWHKHYDVHITLVFVFVPVSNLGYTMLCRAQTLGEALIANRLSYTCGLYLLPILVFSVFSLCQLHLNRWVRVGILGVNTLLFLSIGGVGENTLFYRSIAFERVGDMVILTKEYGPLHTAFYAMIFILFLMGIGAIVYSYARKKQVSRKLIYLLFLPIALSMVSFFGGRQLMPNIEFMPAANTIALAVYLFIVCRLCLYDVTETAVDTLVAAGETGFVAFDFHLNYLGSNEQAKALFPALNDLTVDSPVSSAPELYDTALKWLNDFRADESRNQCFYEKDNRIFLIQAGYLYDGRRKRGYQLYITDDTSDRQYINLLGRFNDQLQSEVNEKTAHIVEMHDKLIISMATMVESRDNSTGGHIRRTSEGVRMLVAEMRGDDGFRLSDSFRHNIVKAAPMHDLGKIAVDDAILRKPGRFTPEEFEKMKAHAAEGARIVHEILTGVEDDEFRVIAENVAHYHHERWDGSGYPEGLSGEAIPLEARIMAIADVYDALVSKRVYKDSMSFEQADAIIMDGMGKHFDARLMPVYVAARPKLEAYYSSLGN